jgi:hypothetical protein
MDFVLVWAAWLIILWIAWLVLAFVPFVIAVVLQRLK